MGGDANKQTRGNFSFSKPRGRGGRGRTVTKEPTKNTKTENRIQKDVQKSSSSNTQDEKQLSSSKKINNTQSTRFNAEEVERKLQQRYDEAMYSALQNATGTRLCRTNQKPWSKGSAPVISSKDFLASLLVAQKDFETLVSARTTDEK